MQWGSLHHNALELALEPVDSIILGDLVLQSDDTGGMLSPGHAESGADEDDVEVHAEDTGGGIVLEAEIDVLVDAEAEAARLREVGLLKLILLHLEGAIEDLVGLSATDL